MIVIRILKKHVERYYAKILNQIKYLYSHNQIIIIIIIIIFINSEKFQSVDE